MADVATVAEENIVGVHVVKSFAQEQAEQDKFERRSETLFAASLRANRQRAFYVPRALVPAAARPGGGAARRRRDGAPTARSRSRTSSPSTSTSRWSIFPLRMLGMWIGEGQRATASGERIFQVIDEPEEIARRAGRARRCRPGPARVRFERRHLRLRPRPCRCCTTSTSSSSPGKTVALIGHTGSGKTTLASLIPRFYDVQQGAVHDRRRRRARRDARPRCAARSA